MGYESLFNLTPPRKKTNHNIIKSRQPLKVSAHEQLTRLHYMSKLTDRDIEILEALYIAGFLTRHQIQRIFFPSTFTANRRLRTLFDLHLIDSGNETWFSNIRKDVDTFPLSQLNPQYVSGLVPCFVYALGLVGREKIALGRGITHRQLGFDKMRYSLLRYGQFILHDLWISEAYTQFRIAADTFQIKMDWKNEKACMLFDDSQRLEIVRPDAFFQYEFETPDGQPISGYYIEMDRGATDWEKKILAYEQALEAGLLWTRSVACVVPQNQKKQAINQIRSGLEGTDFVVKTLREFLINPICGWWSVDQEREIAFLPKNMTRKEERYTFVP